MPTDESQQKKDVLQRLRDIRNGQVEWWCIRNNDPDYNAVVSVLDDAESEISKLRETVHRYRVKLGLPSYDTPELLSPGQANRLKP